MKLSVRNSCSFHLMGNSLGIILDEYNEVDFDLAVYFPVNEY